jgi:hypothetical protein
MQAEQLGNGIAKASTSGVFSERPKVRANTILQWIRLPPRGVIVSGYLH